MSEFGIEPDATTFDLVFEALTRSPDPYVPLVVRTKSNVRNMNEEDASQNFPSS